MFIRENFERLRDQTEALQDLQDSLFDTTGLELEISTEVADTAPGSRLGIVVGHSRNSPGAWGVAPINAHEYAWNLELAEWLSDQARRLGLATKIFLRDGHGIAGAYRLAEIWGAERVLELHFNAFNARATGTETLHAPTSQASAFAKIVQRHMVSVLGRSGSTDRPLLTRTSGQRGGASVNALPGVPIALVEPFFGDNPVDARLGHDRKMALAAALAAAAKESFESERSDDGASASSAGAAAANVNWVTEELGLETGDVLLYRNNSFLAKLIRLFDGTAYSHAAIWDGGQVLEAITKGIALRPLTESLRGNLFIDVYRYPADGGELSQQQRDGLRAACAKFAVDKDRYAYEQIFLLSFLAATRRAPLPRGLARVIRRLLDSAASSLSRVIAAGREPMICSELVYRCHGVAGISLQIRRVDLAAFVGTPGVGAMGLEDLEEKAMREVATAFLEEYMAVKHLNGGESAFTAPIGIMAIADFVTPGDLSLSPSLRKVGRIAP